MAISTGDKTDKSWQQQYKQIEEPGLQRRPANSAENRAAYVRTGSRGSSSSDTTSVKSGSSARSQSTANTSDVWSAAGSDKSQKSVRSASQAVGMFAKGLAMTVSGAATRLKHEAKAKKLDTRADPQAYGVQRKLAKASLKAERADTKMAAGKGLMQAALSGEKKSAELSKTMGERKQKAVERKQAREARAAGVSAKFKAYGEGQG